ncbi:MAG: small, acid-soluble spore protein, alpha/beta type [Lachnospiraceae bacterium]|nr:small, acid-soluble spore protein, alpha/beta type [Lachnospiraceae bacterium]
MNGKFDLLSDKDKMKYEIAEELGLLEQVREKGWKSLSAKEAGKIGGIMTARMKKSMENKNNRKI